MTTTLLVLLAIVALLGAAFARMRAGTRESELAPAPPPKPRRTVASSGQSAGASRRAAARRPDAIEWDGAVAPRPAPAIELDARNARIRDRYIAARFPGTFRGSSDLHEVEYVITAARHLFEEGDLHRANELFALAIEESNAPLALRLAQIEIAFLARDVALFTRLASDLNAVHPGIAEWVNVVRLGRALVPADPLFRGDADHRADEHYGPWPEMPNWIQASWDLTSEVLAAEFHHAMAAGAQRESQPAVRRVA